ncbi:MAG TPA: DUF3175 domain-containing protein [Steroidobacteraceae bacterium]|jgi:hypothetical protein|nr:DUF3175 domain-containing protein [Steroidobacteraceae bacterium]
MATKRSTRQSGTRHRTRSPSKAKAAAGTRAKAAATSTKAKAKTARRGVKRWSGDVTEHSHAMDLDPGVFKRTDPRSIARSLKRSAEQSHNLKSPPFRSAMSMLNFYINRAGRDLDASQRQRLQAAKSELRTLYGRPQR